MYAYICTHIFTNLQKNRHIHKYVHTHTYIHTVFICVFSKAHEDFEGRTDMLKERITCVRLCVSVWYVWDCSTLAVHTNSKKNKSRCTHILFCSPPQPSYIFCDHFHFARLRPLLFSFFLFVLFLLAAAYGYRYPLPSFFPYGVYHIYPQVTHTLTQLTGRQHSTHRHRRRRTMPTVDIHWRRDPSAIHPSFVC